MESLAAHSKLGQGYSEEGPDEIVEAYLKNYLLDQFRSCSWSIPKDFLSIDHFRRVVMSLDWTSSPGHPYLYSYPTNRDFFKVVNGVPEEARLQAVFSLVKQRISDESRDYIRLFIKAEPHKRSKIKEHRYRLISSVSVVDQLVDLLLFQPLNETMINNWPIIPPKVGWTPLLYGWSIIPRDGVVTSDKGGWDWTVKMWLVELVLWLRLELCKTQGATRDLWTHLARWRYRALFVEPDFVLSSGLVLRQKNPGVMKSGCVNTIADNSIMQVILHARICLEMGVDIPDILCMGDDTLQERSDWSADTFREYQNLARRYCKLKVMQPKAEFCGFEFHGARVEPCYNGKHAFQVLHASENIAEDLARSYALLYHRSEQRDKWRHFVSFLGPVPPLPILSIIWDGVEE